MVKFVLFSEDIRRDNLAEHPNQEEHLLGTILN